MSSSYWYVPRAWTDRKGARLVNSVENGFESSTLSCWIMLLQECTRRLQVPTVELALVPYYRPTRIYHASSSSSIDKAAGCENPKPHIKES
jgi:hypothetical protein